jgi:hypothetical protein
MYGQPSSVLVVRILKPAGPAPLLAGSVLPASGLRLARMAFKKTRPDDHVLCLA